MTLTALWVIPLVGGGLVAFLPPRLAKWMGVLVFLGPLAELGNLIASGVETYQIDTD